MSRRMELHSHSMYSNIRLLDSTNRPDKLIEQAQKIGLAGIALTDHECLSASIEVNKIAAKLRETNPEFKIALGNEIYLTNTRDMGQKYYHFILIARDAQGHRQLRELSSLAWMNSYFDRGMERVPTLKKDLERVVKLNPGHLIATTACIGGELGSTILELEASRKTGDINGEAVAKKQIIDFVLWCKDVFGDNFYFETAPGASREQIIVNKKIAELSQVFGVKMVIGTDAHYLTKNDSYVHEAYLNSKSGDRETRQFYEYAYLQTEEDYNLFINGRNYINKVIEIEISEKSKKEDNNSINLNQSESTIISDDITFNTCLNNNNLKEEKITKKKTNENPKFEELMKQIEELNEKLKNREEQLKNKNEENKVLYEENIKLRKKLGLSTEPSNLENNIEKKTSQIIYKDLEKLNKRKINNKNNYENIKKQIEKQNNKLKKIDLFIKGLENTHEMIILNEEIQKQEIIINSKSENITQENNMKNLGDQLYKILINQMIINDLEESFKIYNSIKKNNEKGDEKKQNKIEELLKKLEKDLLKNSINNKDENEVFNKIIEYLSNNQFDKKIYNTIYNLIDYIEDLNNDIYVNKEIESLKDKKIEKEFNEIGNKKLNEVLAIEPNLKEEIDKFNNIPTNLKFNFVKMNQDNNNNNKFYEKIKIFGQIYETSLNVKLVPDKLKSYNDFESQTIVELINEEDLNKNKKFIININLHQENHYHIIINVKEEEKTYSTDINYYSIEDVLLPNNVNISNIDLEINNSLYNMKRLVLLNISKKELLNYLNTFEYYKDNINEKIEEILFNNSDLFINILFQDKNNQIVTASPNIENNPNDLKKEDKDLMNKCYEILEINKGNLGSDFR